QSALGIVADVTTWITTQWTAIPWARIWAQVTTIGSGLIEGAASIADSVTTWIGTQWASVDWKAVWAQVKGHGAALAESRPPIAEDVTTWLIAQAKLIDWNKVWTAAGTVQTAMDALVDLLNSADVSPITAAMTRFLIRAVKQAVKAAFAPGAGGA